LPLSDGYPYWTSIPNAGYPYWTRVDQLVHAWLFTNIFNGTLSEVRYLSHSLQVWYHLQCFNVASLARALDLKRMLTNLSLGNDQTIDSYLQSIKSITDSLVAIKSPFFDIELIQLTTVIISNDYYDYLLYASDRPQVYKCSSVDQVSSHRD